MLSTLSTQSVANDTLLQDAQSMIAQGQFQQAYTLLEGKVLEQAGNSDFDYLLGLSALQAKKPGRAIFALERAVANDPNNGGARFDLARALYAVKQYKQAKTQLDRVLQMNPPERVRKLTHDYLTMIQRQLSESSLQADIQLTIGDDLNVNSATNDDFIGDFELDDNSKATRSAVYDVQANIAYFYKLSTRNSWSVNAANIRRTYPSATFINQDIRFASTGLQHKAGSWTSKWNISDMILLIDSDFNSSTLGTQADLQYQIGKHLISGTVSGSQVRYASGYELRNINQVSGTLGHRVTVSKNGLHLLSSNIRVSFDKPLMDDSEYERMHTKIGHNGILSAGDKSSLHYGVSVDYSDYKRDFFSPEDGAKDRNDWSYTVSMGVAIKPAKNWQVMPQILQTRRQSTLSLYSFEKTNITLGIKRSL